MGKWEKGCNETLCYECPFAKTKLLCNYAKDNDEEEFKKILDDFKKEIQKVESNG